MYDMSAAEMESLKEEMKRLMISQQNHLIFGPSIDLHNMVPYKNCNTTEGNLIQ